MACNNSKTNGVLCLQRKEQIAREVKGFLVPVFQEKAPDGRFLNGLDEISFAKVRAGYACADCLAEFDKYTAVCPVCGLSRDVEADVKEAPRLWTEHLRERHLDVPAAKPDVINPFAGGPLPPDFTLPEMDTVPLSKLRKSKWGRGG